MGIDISEDLIPFEIDFYVNLLKEWMDKQEKQARELGYQVG
jgi:hypothetical protein